MDLTPALLSPDRTHDRFLQYNSVDGWHCHLDNTSTEKFLQCPKQFYMYSVLGRDNGPSDATGLGSAMHNALEHLYKGGTQEECLQVLLNYFTENPPEEGSWRTLDFAVSSFKIYYLRYQQGLHAWNVLDYHGTPAVEIPFRLPFAEYQLDLKQGSTLATLLVRPDQRHQLPADGKILLKVFRAGKIDLVVSNEHGNWVVDHKTTSMVGSTFWSAFELSAQMRGYVWAAQHLFPELVFEGAMVNALICRKPTKTGVAHEFDWHPFPYTQEQITTWHDDQQHHLNRLIHTLFHTNQFPESPNHCSNKYGMCSYHSVCNMSKQAQPIVLMSGQYSEKTWSPLKT